MCARNTICLLGAGGFLGARIVEMALSQPDLAIVPVLRSYRSMARLSKLGLILRKVDVNNADDLVHAMEGCDTVVNATTGDWLAALPDTQRFIDACRKAGVRRYIHLSSAAIFGSVDNPVIDDDSVAQGADWFLYATEKARAEAYMREAMKSTNGPAIVVLRPGLIWGPRSGWVTRAAGELRIGKAWLANGGSGICNLCHVDNLARFVLQAAKTPTGIAGFYNVADREMVTWREYYEAIAVALGLPPERVYVTTAARIRPSPALLIEWLKSQPVGYRLMRWLIASLSPKAKSLIKWYLPAMGGGGRSMPPLDAGAVATPGRGPRFNRETWTLHHTRRKLPIDKFVRDFGDPGLQPWTESMRGTSRWLEEAGFGDF